MPLPSATRWALAIAFLGGFVGGDAISVVFAGPAAFILATAWPRTPWRAALLVLAASAAGTAVTVLLNYITGVRGLEPPSELGPGLTVLAAYASAAAGAALAWVASRLERQR